MGARLTDRRPGTGHEELHTAFLTSLCAETALSHPDGPVVPVPDWLRAQRTRTRHRARWAEWFDDVDVQLCPVVPTVAFPHDQRGASRERRIAAADGTVRLGSALTVWTGIASALYLPAAVVPVGLTEDGLPLAVQVVGPRFGDRTVVAVAAAIARLVGTCGAPPENKR